MRPQLLFVVVLACSREPDPTPATPQGGSARRFEIVRHRADPPPRGQVTVTELELAGDMLDRRVLGRTLQSYVPRIRTCSLPAGKTRFDVTLSIAPVDTPAWTDRVEAVDDAGVVTVTVHVPSDDAGASDHGLPAELVRGEAIAATVRQTDGPPGTDLACVQAQLEGLAMAIPRDATSIEVRFVLTSDR